MASHELEIDIPTDHDGMTGTLIIPDQPQGLVLFAHGSGSSRFSPRNRFVAGSLHRAGSGRCFSTCSRLTRNAPTRLPGTCASATAWLAAEKIVPFSHLGYFGASTGEPLLSSPPQSDPPSSRAGDAPISPVRSLPTLAVSCGSSTSH